MRLRPALLLLAALAFAACDSTDADEPDLVVDLGDTVTLTFQGRLDDGRIFQPNATATYTLRRGALIEGFLDAVLGMRVGESKTVVIPPEKGYGADPPRDSGIPPNATLTFDIEVLEIL